MRFESIKIGEIAEVKGGKRLPKGFNVQDDPTDHPYLRVVDFDDNGLNFSNIRFITNEVYEAIRHYTITSKDIYVSIAGTIGRVGIVPAPYSGANLTENAAKITNISDSVHAPYLCYFLKGYTGQKILESKAGGTSQPKLALHRIAEVEFPNPPLERQKRIASILSAYDELIENNRRRIALLERAARELYREWFARLRFPGHDYTKIVDGVPEGWERTELGGIGQLKYGKALKAEDRIDGKFPVYGSSGIIGTHDEAHVQGPGIIVGRKGNVGSVYWSDESFCAIDTAYFFEPSASSLYIYYALQNVNFINTDVAVPGLNRNFAHSRKILMPNDQVRDAFDDVAVPIHKQISLLRKENESLMRARDLLLPRLMSGELAV